MAVKKNEKKNSGSFSVIAAVVVLIGSISFMATSCGSGTINSNENSGDSYSSNEADSSDAYNTNENSSDAYSSNEDSDGETNNSNYYVDLIYSYENITREKLIYFLFYFTLLIFNFNSFLRY